MLGPGWNHVVRVGRVIKAAIPLAPIPAPCPVTENPARNTVTTTVKKGKNAKSAPKVKVGPKEAPVTKSKSSKKPKEASQPKKPVVPTQSPL